MASVLPAETSPTVRIRWRSDLSVVARSLGGKPGRLIEDPACGVFHRMGEREYAVARRLDGLRSPTEAAELAAQEDGFVPFTTAERELFIRRLLELRLVEALDARGETVRLPETKSPGRFDPFFLRIPIWNPQRFLDAILPWTGGLFTPTAAIAATISGVILLSLTAGRYHEFSDSLARIHLPDGWLTLLVCWLSLKAIHETAHGLTCRKFGGYVREAGVSFIFFAPAPYVDVTSVWRFPSRRERIAVSAAGMYAELLVAIACGWLWLGCEQPAVRQVCANVVLLAVVSTVLFNANPLLRFDGYFILSDWLDFPNLYAIAARRANARARQIFFGKPMLKDGLRGTVALWTELYGVAAWLWRWSSLAVLAITVIVLYEGAGAALVGAAAVLWFGRQTIALAKNLRTAGPPRPLWRPIAVSTLILGVAYLLGTNVREPFAPRSPGVVRLADETPVRASSPGFVRKLSVVDGERVEAGQVIAELENEELQTAVRQALADEARSRVRARVLEQERDLVEWQVELARGAALAEKSAELQRQADGLTLRAPTAGRVFARRLSEAVGRYLAVGDLLCIIGDDARLEIRAAAAQETAPRFAAAVGRSVTLTTAAGERFIGEVVSVEPRGSRELFEPSLAATNGGGLGVRETPDASGRGSHLELLEPHFTAVIRPTDGARPAAGQRCDVFLPGAEQSVAERLWTLTRDRLRSIGKRG